MPAPVRNRAKRMARNQYDIRTVQELLGHHDLHPRPATRRTGRPFSLGRIKNSSIPILAGCTAGFS
jgi:hypothetical protein